MRKIISTIAFLVIMASCTTISVTKVTPTNNPEGIRYALGKPFIKVTPNPSGDGTYTAELVYLPDDNQVYAVKASSFMTKYTLELNVDESGILKKLDLSKSTASPASDIVNTIGELTKTELDTRNKKTEEAEKELKAAIKTNKEEQKKLIESIEQKKVDLQNVINEVASLKTLSSNAANDERIRVAELGEKKIGLELKVLEEKLARLKVEAVGFNSSANDPRSKPMAYGPVLFEIKETQAKPGIQAMGKNAAVEPVHYDLKLVAVKWDRTETKQKQFETSLKPATTKPPQEYGPDLTESVLSATFDANGKTEVIVKFNKPIIRVIEKESKLVDTKGEEKTYFFDKVNFELKEAALKLEIDKTNVLPGEYSVFIYFIYEGKNKKEEEGDVTFSLTLKDKL